MQWNKGRDRDRDGRAHGPALENVRESEHGHIIACVRLRGSPHFPAPTDRYAYILSYRGEQLGVRTNLPDMRDEKQKAFGELKALAEQHWKDQVS